MPRFVLINLYKEGHTLWKYACFLPPSAFTILAYGLVRLESSDQGLNAASFSVSFTSEVNYSIASVVRMLAIDVVLYGLLTLYLDKVGWGRRVGWMGGGVMVGDLVDWDAILVFVIVFGQVAKFY